MMFEHIGIAKEFFTPPKKTKIPLYKNGYSMFAANVCKPLSERDKLKRPEAMLRAFDL